MSEMVNSDIIIIIIIQEFDRRRKMYRQLIQDDTTTQTGNFSVACANSRIVTSLDLHVWMRAAIVLVGHWSIGSCEQSTFFWKKWKQIMEEKWPVYHDELRRVPINFVKKLRGLLSLRNTSMEKVLLNCRRERRARGCLRMRASFAVKLPSSYRAQGPSNWDAPWPR
jgi:hypothetical protein